MASFTSLPDPTDLADVLRRFPVGWPALLDAHDSILRAPASLSVGERELIAAYVSALNACAFCTAAHTAYAERYGVLPGVVDALLDAPERAAVEVQLLPVLAYARSLTRSPEQAHRGEVEAIRRAGWPEETVMEATMVVALFAFMNRIVLGMGVAPFAERYRDRLDAIRRLPVGRRLEANARDVGTTPYREYGRSIGLIRD